MRERIGATGARVKRKRREEDKETRRLGDKETGRLGDKETRRLKTRREGLVFIPQSEIRNPKFPLRAGRRRIPSGFAP